MTEQNVEEVEEGEGGAKGKLKTIIMIVVGALLLVGLSVFGTWFMLKDQIAEPDMPDVDELPLEEPVMDVTVGEAIYHAMQPAFVINYDVGGRARFMQVELSVLTRDPAAIEVLILHNPLIRNNLLDVFQVQNLDHLMSAEGKQQLADQLTDAIQDILIIEMGRPAVESVLFRSFIIQ